MSILSKLTFVAFFIFCNSVSASFMGINTNEVTSFDPSVPFVDLFKGSDPFSESRQTAGLVQFDSNGWVINLNGGTAGTHFLKYFPFGALQKGNYTVRYEGSGKIEYSGEVNLVKSNNGKDLISFYPNAHQEVNAILLITDSDPNNPIRNISITPPGGICQNNPFKVVYNQNQCAQSRYLSFEYYHKNIIFNPQYLHFMKPFKALRFMNMAGITRNPVEHWAHRPKVEQATWGGNEGTRGAPLEIMVKLSNILNANPWFNIPHKASNDYVLRHAQYVEKNLRNNLKAYLEYTNEAWNPIFTQTHYVRTKGVAEGLDQKLYWAGIKFYSKRSKEVFQIWKRVFARTPQRLVTVLSGWAENPQITKTLLDSSEVFKYTDAFAIAPYFYADEHELMATKSVNDIFSLINDPSKKRSISRIIGHVKKQYETVSAYGIDLVAYEGGQALVHLGTTSKKQHPNPLIRDANRDDRMENAYINLINGFINEGGNLFMSFSAPRVCSFHSGCMGLIEHIQKNPNESPKYRAIRRYF